jgi:hypothetical protein
LGIALGCALSDSPPDHPELFYLEDWPRLISDCAVTRWGVTREDRITPTLRRLRADPDFRRAREGMLRALCRYLDADDMPCPARRRRVAVPPYSDEVTIDLDVLKQALAAWDVAALAEDLDRSLASPAAAAPVDLSAFIPAKDCLDPPHCPTYKTLRAILDGHPEIRTHKPSPQRLLIHAGDWHRYTARRDANAFEALDTDPATVNAFLADTQARQEAIREGKARK